MLWPRQATLSSILRPVLLLLASLAQEEPWLLFQPKEETVQTETQVLQVKRFADQWQVAQMVQAAQEPLQVALLFQLKLARSKVARFCETACEDSMMAWLLMAQVRKAAPVMTLALKLASWLRGVAELVLALAIPELQVLQVHVMLLALMQHVP